MKNYAYAGAGKPSRLRHGWQETAQFAPDLTWREIAFIDSTG